MNEDAEKWDAWTVPLVWEGEHPTGHVLKEIEDAIRTELEHELGDLRHPSDLVFHTIWLEDRVDGPTVTIYGKDGSDAMHVELDLSPKWVTERPNA